LPLVVWGPEHVLRGNLSLAAIAVVGGCFLTSVLKFTPLWTVVTVAGALVILAALFLLLTTWSRSD
jgi:hypothetical protein